MAEIIQLHDEEADVDVLPITHKDAVFDDDGNKVIEQLETKIETLNTNLTDLGKSVSDGKSAIASAITAKGVSTKSDATFATMSKNIRNISTSKKVTIRATKTVGGGDISLYANGTSFGSVPSSGMFDKSFTITV